MSFRTESKNKTINKSANSIYNFLTDFQNFKILLPVEKIHNWQNTSDSCSFELEGLGTLSLHIKNRIENKIIQYASADDAKFPFDLFIEIEALGNRANCKVYMDLHMNVAVKYFAQKPIESFVNLLVDKLEEIVF